MPDNKGIFTINNTTYNFNVASATVNEKAAAKGRFAVTIGDKTTSVTGVDLMLIVYSARNISGNQSIQKMSEVAEKISNYTSAASELNKVFSLYAASFDGEFFKSGMAPTGSIGAATSGSIDSTVYNNEADKPTAVQARTAYMTLAHIEEAIRAYDDLKKAYDELVATDADGKRIYGDVLEQSGIDPKLPAYPFGTYTNVNTFNYTLSSATGGGANSWSLGNIKMMTSSKAFTTLPGIGANFVGQMWVDQFDEVAKFMAQFTAYGKTGNDLSYMGNGRIEPGKFATDYSYGYLMRLVKNNGDNSDNYVGGVLWGVNQSITAYSNSNATFDEKVTALAMNHFCQGMDYNASKFNELKETWTNEMSKYNTNLQLVMQETNRAISKTDSAQSMFDKAIDKMFSNYDTIAKWQ